ncbi:MAG: PilZ domain-containing protein [Bdellovibrionota bacterium]
MSQPVKTMAERRLAKRRPILETFSIFVVVPKKGVHRLKLGDLSEIGIGFDLDIEGEPQAGFPMASGGEIGLRLYLNQSLYLPLVVKVVRVEKREGFRRVGATFSDAGGKVHNALVSFLHMLDDVIDVAKIETQPAKI